MLIDSYSSSEERGDVDSLGGLSEHQQRLSDSGQKVSVSEKLPDSTDLGLPASENEANYERLSHYKEEFTSRLLRLIMDTEFEYGFTSDLDAFLNERLAENRLATKSWLCGVFIDYFYRVSIATALLRTVAHLDYEVIEPEGLIMAVAALTHENAEVRECGIRAFENWAAPQSLRVLKAIHCPEGWLRDYLREVVRDLEEALAPNAVSGAED